MHFIQKILTRRFDPTIWPTGGHAIGARVDGPFILHQNLPLSAPGFDASRIEAILRELKLPCSVTNIQTGPVTTSYSLSPIESTRIGLLPSRSVDIAVRLDVDSVQVDSNKLIVENPTRQLVDFTHCSQELFNQGFDHEIPFVIGVDSTGKIRIGDLAKNPHTLVAGSTGSGKSNQINAIMASILSVRHPTNVRLVMIDPKRVEYAQYQNLPHLLHPVIDEIPHAIHILAGLCELMDNRYKWLKDNGYQSVELYNKSVCPRLDTATPEQLKKKIYPIVVFIDEYADLKMQDKKAEFYVTRLAQKARAAGIHLVLCTQMPKANIISTTVTTNLPTQIAFNVKSRSASGVILDRGGAEKLLRQGDMLYQDANECFRAQGPFVANDLTEMMVNHWRQ